MKPIAIALFLSLVATVARADDPPLTLARDKKPGELSGGMRQRVSVARALAMDPQILLLDEPLSALDALTRATLQDEISRIRSESNKTVLLITNDPDEGIYLADRIIPLTAGPNATLGPSFTVEIQPSDSVRGETVRACDGSDTNVPFAGTEYTSPDAIRSAMAWRTVALLMSCFSARSSIEGSISPGLRPSLSAQALQSRPAR